jgi:hypothetical protein
VGEGEAFGCAWEKATSVSVTGRHIANINRNDTILFI